MTRPTSVSYTHLDVYKRQIVDNLKHLGKQDRGHMDELADIGKILQAVVSLLDARIRKHTDAFSLDLPAALPAVRGNVQQLRCVLETDRRQRGHGSAARGPR